MILLQNITVWLISSLKYGLRFENEDLKALQWLAQILFVILPTDMLQLVRTCTQPILNGRDSVRKVLETFQERGSDWGKIATQYYGPVIENFTCDKTIYTAVEVSDNTFRRVNW